RLLLPGDIEAPVEARLVESLATSDSGLGSDILLMPHHGSASSSTADFVKAVHPQLVIAQTGFLNRYGFPADEVLMRYREQESELRNTAEGAVLIDFKTSSADSKLHDAGWVAHVSGPVESAKRKRALQWWHDYL
ncbi:MAG: hypothetical protein Q9M30_06820, partial [Mariprofundaceae bacterium]|nr:hypothetical protein [Mariprofundaceae bacterium]